MIVAVTSPDSITISMFTEFLRKGRLQGAPFVNLNGLLSADVLDSIVEESLKRPYRDIIFRHKTRHRLQPTKVPPLLMDRADSIIGFDLYSMHPETIKSCQGWTEIVLSEWKSYEQSLNR